MTRTIQAEINSAAVVVGGTTVAEEEATPSGKEVVVEESTSGISEQCLIHTAVHRHTICLRNGKVIRTFTDTNGMIVSG